MIEDYKSFLLLGVVEDLHVEYRKCQLLARAAIEQLTHDMKKVEAAHMQASGNILFTSFDSRVKEADSFFRKLHRSCVRSADNDGFSDKAIKKSFYGIKDVAGARFACPYLADVVETVSLIKSELFEHKYAVKIDGEEYSDQNMIEDGDKFGYRSYHFYVKVPTIVNIFGESEAVICELQGRSELQDVWAIKSHELLYKNKKVTGNLDKYRTHMKHISDNLKVADYFLSEVRDDVRKAEKEEK